MLSIWYKQDIILSVQYQILNVQDKYKIKKCLSVCLHVFSTTKENHQILLRAITVKSLINRNIFYTIFFNNQLCFKLLNNVTVLLKPVHTVRQIIDKGSCLKVSSFRQLVFTPVLALISSLRPIIGMSLSDEESNVCRSQNKPRNS